MSEFLPENPIAITPSETSTSVQQVGAGQQFLRFHLAPDTLALLSLDQITEVLTIPLAQILPIPHMPNWVSGVYNWRGEILWLVDLGHLIGLPPWHEQALDRSTCRVIVIHGSVSAQQAMGSPATESQILGLIVNQVEEIEWCNPNLIQFPPRSSVAPELVPFLGGYWLKPNHGEILVVLEGKSILSEISGASKATPPEL